MKEQELTVLFYFASDNPLAPLVVSEIKAIKDAGFQENTNVLVFFDPMEKGAPTQLIDVNSARKKDEKTFIGDGRDPFVRNMTEDQVDMLELTPQMQATLTNSSNVPAVKSLGNFIDFALKNREAKNYMLFLVGHGMIVGNDAFLPDDDPVSAISLEQLQELCGRFSRKGKTLQLLGLHSCSMSSIEVAYQLKGLANYMVATQGTTFVNGWPYRQMLKKILNQINRAKANGGRKPVNYPQLIEKLYFLCLFNFTDFLTAGYSCDLVLCNLDRERSLSLKEPLKALVSELKQGLDLQASIIEDLILLAHWEAQSFWSENYTDLWDFCSCLAERCDAKRLEIAEKDEATAEQLDRISKKCAAVRKVLAPDDGKRPANELVRFADNCGSEFQYAHGLSIYFPWCEPLDDQRAVFGSKQDDTERRQREARSRKALSKYAEYAFTKEFEADSWLSFLKKYFKTTKRDPRFELEARYFDDIATTLRLNPEEAEVVFTKARETFNAGVLKRIPELKKSPIVGVDCTCPSIKNYPTMRFPKGPVRKLRGFSITPRALRAFLSNRRPKRRRRR